MNKLGEITLADIAAGLKRYQPFIAAVVAVVLVVAFLPGDPKGPSGVAAGGDVEIADIGGSTGDGADADDGGAEGGTTTGDGASSGGGTRGGASGGASSGGRSRSAGGSGGGGVSVPDGPVANCDTSRGRLALPVHVSPPCTQAYDGDNGGSTYQGVTADTIKVVVYVAQANAATEAALTAAGANNSSEDRRATMEGFNEIFNFHYNFWGRQVQLEFFEASGATDDDAAGKADAIKIATELKPFAVINAPNNSFVRELAARGVLCICTASQPQEFYESLDPYVGYTSLPSSTQGYIHRAEYLCKRLKGRKAVHADDPTLQLADRKFGILYFETADNAYKSGVDFFETLLADCGSSLAVRLAYTGPPDLATTQEQARPFIQRMKDEGVTSVIFSGDFLSPAIFTQEATRQRYFPEWIITGSVLTDTTIFARTYDPAQWANAFGISYLSARYPDEEGDVFNLYQWHHGRTPEADNQFGVLYSGMLPLYIGMMLAGENLTPQSFQAGLFAFPPTNGNMVTAGHVSWGDHGIWPFRDYTALDDVAEIWWDTDASGEDEVGNPGVGMYRYVAGGKRYLPGQHPTSDPFVFNEEGTVTVYETRPENERAPQYPPPEK